MERVIATYHDASTGPRPFGRGNNVIAFTDAGGIFLLQRGRVLSGAETRAGAPGRGCERCASTGPRPFGRGNSKEYRLNCFTGYWTLQRGRVLSGAETHFHQHRDVAFTHASTGPRPFGRGNHQATGKLLAGWTLLQRGRVLSGAETAGNGWRLQTA